MLQNGTTFATGKVGQGFSFDGTDDHVTIPASPSLDVGVGGGFTIEGWINPTDVNSQHVLWEWNDGVGDWGVHVWFSIPSYGGVRSIFANIQDASNGDHFIASPSGLLNTGNFQHIAVTYSKSTGVAKIYYNGSIVANQNLGVFTPQTASSLYLGMRPTGPGAPSYFEGVMDEVSLYDRSLADAEILAIYNAGAAGKCKAGPPSILVQPTDRVVARGANVTLSVVASGLGLGYQWLFHNGIVTGGTNATLQINQVGPQHAGDYSVIVSNASGSVPSSNATLSIIEACPQSPDSLSNWWPADGNGMDLFNGGGLSLFGGLGFTNGKVNQALSFDGVDDHASTTPGTTDIGSGDGMTIECWILPTNVTAPQALIEWNNGSGPGVQVWMSVVGYGGPGSLFANITGTNGANHILFSADGVLTSNFQHVALTYNRTSGVATLYRNGAVVASQSIGNFRPQTTYALSFGKRVSGSTPSYYQGALDEIALYHRALTASEILSIYLADSNGKSCQPPEVVVQPQSKTVYPGSNVTFTVGSRGSEPLSLQWIRNGAVLPGATNLTLTVSNAQPSVAGSYALHVTNAIGTAQSSNALLKVIVISAFGNGQSLTNSTHAFNNEVSVQLQNAYAGGLVFYTLDGSQPTFTSSQYTGSFVISNSSTLRALGYSADFLESGELDPVNILLPPAYPLTISSSGGGSVSANPPNGPHLSNSVVTLTATPFAGWMFLKWMGDASGTSPTTNLTITRSKSVKAIFGTTINTTAAGGGSVILNPPGGIYPYGTTVQLAAVPNPGNQFALWGNAASGNVNPLLFVLTNANPTVSSLFAVVSGGQSALTVVPVGRGQVTVNPRANAYATGTGVSITATPDSGQSFLGWSGDAVGSQNPLATTVNSNRTIFANFTLRSQLTIGSSSDALRTEGPQLTILGNSGEAYRLESSTNLSQWSLVTDLTNSYGSVQFTDSAATNSARNFYRAR